MPFTRTLNDAGAVDSSRWNQAHNLETGCLFFLKVKNTEILSLFPAPSVDRRQSCGGCRSIPSVYAKVRSPSAVTYRLTPLLHLPYRVISQRANVPGQTAI